MLIRIRTLACVAVLTLPACVIKLADRNSPEENGGVTGPPADCSKVTVEPGGAPSGEALPKFVGRFATVGVEGSPEPVPIFDWSGNYITLRFQGTDRITVKLLITGPMISNVLVAQDQMFAFIVDDRPPDIRRLTVKNNPNGEPTNVPQEEYEIVGLAPNAAHEVTIHKNTEAQKGSVIFKGFDLHGGTLLPPTRRKRWIEFIGDSIMCGYGNMGANATCPFEVEIRKARDQNGQTVFKEKDKPVLVTVPVTENQYLSFTALAARELDADAVTICWSGKGVYLNYKERKLRTADGKGFEDEQDTRTTLPELWETRTIGNDNAADKKWDFAKENPEEAPDVVVISLGTNDFARDNDPPPTDPDKLSGDNVPDRTMDNPAQLDQFKAKYLALVQKVRMHRPQAHIFLATPPMITDQFPLDNARRTVRDTLLGIVAQLNDPKIYQMDLVEQGFRYGLGCDYHPNLEVHRIMARQLVGAIKSKTCWAR